MLKKQDWKKKLQKVKDTFGIDKVILLLLAGILLLLSTGTPSGGDGASGQEKTEQKNGGGQESAGDTTQGIGETGADAAGAGTYEAGLEQRLEEVLAHIEGAGEVQVMVTLKDSGERVLQSDSSIRQSDTTEQDGEGGSRSVSESDQSRTTVVLSDGTGDTPYITREIMPEVEGVLVVAQGAGNSAVKQSIYQAVQALFGVPAHKIKVLKGVLGSQSQN